MAGDRIYSRNESYINDICLRKLLAMLDPEAFDLISDFSMTAYGLVFLMNEIVLNKRRNIIEFGSGLSTVLMAAVIKKYKIPATIISIENDEAWFRKINEKIKQLDLSHIVQLVNAPLVADKRLGNENRWYDATLLDNIVEKTGGFDMVLIDGPPAHSPSIELSRYGAIPFLNKRLANNYTIFLDDANRSGERKIIERWEKEYSHQFFTYHNHIATSRKGVYINSYPSLILGGIDV